MENKINFLNTAISDAQELIRFTDTKTAIVITILGAYIVAFFSSLDKIIEYSGGYSLIFWFFLVLFFIFLSVCIWITARIIIPTNNPFENITLGSVVSPLKFFIGPNKYKENFYPFRNSKEFKLEEDCGSYIETLLGSSSVPQITDSDIIKSLSIELFKVSFIRNIKNDRFKILLWFLLATTIAFFISFLFYAIETHNTIESLKTIQNGCCK
jgi:hypothetical protein